MKSIQQLSNNPLIETVNKIVSDKYIEVISRSTPSSNNKAGILQTFKELARMDSLEVNLQDQSSKEIILMVGITFYENQASPEEMKELVGVLENIKVTD